MVHCTNYLSSFHEFLDAASPSCNFFFLFQLTGCGEVCNCNTQFFPPKKKRKRKGEGEKNVTSSVYI